MGGVDFGGMAELVIAITGLVTAIWAIVKGSKKERVKTAEKTIQNVTGKRDGDEDGDLGILLEMLAEELRDRRDGRHHQDGD